MAIRLPGISEQLEPAMQGIRSLFKNIANPNYDQQMALRQALLEGRIDPQTLTDLGPEEVEKRFGKGTGHFASGNKSLKSKVEGLKGERIQELLKRPDTDPEKQELLANLGGTKDPTERKLGEQNVQRNQQVIETEEQKRARETENRVTANRAIMRIGGKENLYNAYQQKALNTQELQAIQATPEYDEVFKFQRDDYWKQQEMEFREKALNERTDPIKAAKEYNIMLARKIVDTTSQSNVQDVSMILEDRSLEKKYASRLPDEAIAKLSPTEQRVYAAAQAVGMNRQMEGDDRKRAAWEYFRKQTAGITGALRDKKVKQRGDQEINGLVDQYNKLAQQLLGPYLEDKEIPQLAFDKNSPRSKDAGFAFFDAPGLYYTQGSDAGLEDAAATKNPLDSWRGRSKQDMDTALGRINDPKQRADLLQKLIQAGIYR